MNKITQILNLKKPEGLQGCFQNSKFSKFKIEQLNEFVTKNFSQTRYSQVCKKEEIQNLLNKPEKEFLIICCIQIELTRFFLFNFSTEELESIIKSNFN